MTLKDHLTTYFYNDFHRWPLWLPILLGMGISLYYSLPIEPDPYWGWGGLVFFLISLLFASLKPLRLFILCLGFISLGFTAALYRTHSLHTQMLNYPLKPMMIEAIVQQVELKPTKKGKFYQRLIIGEVKAEIPLQLPQKIRISMKGKRERLWPGQVIRMRVKLTPISEPSFPRGFDFRRQAYFQGLGATGFALSPPEVIGDSESWGLVLEKKREKITAYFLQVMKPPYGGIAAALITGDKAAIPEEIREYFIQSGLAHILAISGLHLSIIAGVVFLLIRRGIALIPPLCLLYNSKKIAAIGTILMTLAYLILSGFGIPAQRAFIMISIVMGAILLNRSALSLRTVAFAAFAILLVTPEALLGPSFQLSFAAVVALITGYEAWKNPIAHFIVGGGPVRRFLIYSGGLAFTSFLATLATLPFTIVLFHRFSLHAIEANLVAVPLTSLVIMPSALCTCLLSPLGLGDYPLWIFEQSLGYLVQIAKTVSNWEGSNIWVAQSHPSSFVFMVMGGLWLCAWHAKWRLWGLFPIFLGVIILLRTEPPHLLIDGGGKLAALNDKGTLYVSSMRKGKYTKDMWAQALAVEDVKHLECKEGACASRLLEKHVVIFEDGNRQKCLKDAILIHFEPAKSKCPQALLSIDWYDLWRGGSHAIWITSESILIEKAREVQGKRPWTAQAIPVKDRP